MNSFLPTIILRHRKENLKKCSLRGLEVRSDMSFYSYPTSSLPPLDKYITLDISGPALSAKDNDHGLFLIDATWKYAATMTEQVQKRETIIKRSLPRSIVTAYPRKQTGCLDPERGLASIEALFISYLILGKPTKNLLDNYYWKQEFLDLNRSFLKQFMYEFDSELHDNKSKKSSKHPLSTEKLF